MRQQWTETDVLALPGGEHDWFERKAGALYATNDRSKLLGPLAKGESAFANTGGGSFIIGIEDDGVTFDGLPAMRGGTPMREWIEQMVPNLVAYPLQEFRVHEVVPDPAGSTIPAGQVVLVVDIGDSAAAPHQCDYASSSSTKGIYYMRQGGHSVPAPHHYVELVRQRLTAPVLTAQLHGVRVRAAGAVQGEGYVFAHVEITVRIRNEGNVAAYKWAYQPDRFDIAEGRDADYETDTAKFAFRDSSSGIRIDDTILPGGAADEPFQLGLRLRPSGTEAGQLPREIETLLNPVTFHYRIATEVGRSEERTIELRDGFDPQALAAAIEPRLE
jgi:hypothetical protein